MSHVGFFNVSSNFYSTEAKSFEANNNRSFDGTGNLKGLQRTSQTNWSGQMTLKLGDPASQCDKFWPWARCGLGRPKAMESGSSQKPQTQTWALTLKQRDPGCHFRGTGFSPAGTGNFPRGRSGGWSGTGAPRSGSPGAI